MGIAEGVALQGGLPQAGHREISLKMLDFNVLRFFYLDFWGIFGVFKNATYILND